MTLGQLCQGTAGLADYRGQFQAQFVNNPTREWSAIELISGGLAAARTEPGTAWQDSATAIGVLGLALTAASGQSWAELYDEYIFTPLGLSETSVPSGDDLTIESPAPHGYAAAVNPDGSRDCAVMHDDTKLSPSLSGVTGGVVSTLDDLKRWSQVLAEGSLLSNRSADAQLATISLGGDSPTWQGYGLGVQTLGPLVGHDGEISGFLTAAYADPATGFTVVVMLNNSTAGKGFAQQLAMQLASIASKAPAAGGATAPVLELPWSAEQATAALQAGAVPAGPRRLARRRTRRAAPTRGNAALGMPVGLLGPAGLELGADPSEDLARQFGVDAVLSGEGVERGTVRRRHGARRLHLPCNDGLGVGDGLRHHRVDGGGCRGGGPCHRRCDGSGGRRCNRRGDRRGNRSGSGRSGNGSSDDLR